MMCWGGREYKPRDVLDDGGRCWRLQGEVANRNASEVLGFEGTVRGRSSGVEGERGRSDVGVWD